MIDDLILLSRLDAADVECQYQPFNLESVIQTAMREPAWRGEGKGLALEYRIAPEVPKLLEGEPAFLTMILKKLPGQRRQVHRGRPDRPRRIRSGREGRGATTSIYVRDTGPGIPAEKLELLFHDLTQVDGSTTRRFGGLGLGLTLARRLLRLMDGRIWAESTPGRGSAFHFILPFRTLDEV